MKSFHEFLHWYISAIVFSLMIGSGVHAEEMMQLAKDGKTSYSIIIGVRASSAEEFAAKELSEFFKQITGAAFPVKRDNTAASVKEIVLGNTNRLSLKDVPSELQPKVNEGFVLYRQGEKLFILGKIQRATLYGVYDFLEVELGVRFLTADATYVPHRDNLVLNVASRKYDPPLEYRAFWVADETWGVRNRLNASWGFVPMEKMLGGVRWVGPSFCHTFGLLVSAKKYFAEHPEYFSLVKGKRVPSNDGAGPAQLCLTNPDVLKISIASAKEWIEQFKASPLNHPDSKLIVSVSINDCEGDCECDACRAVNKEEGSRAGTVMRFVNAVAEALQKDYSNVAVETLAYAYAIDPPKVTTPGPNVIIRFAPLDSDFARSLDDPMSERNRIVYKTLTGWSKICNQMYIWNYYCGNNFAFLEPDPELYIMRQNTGIFLKNGMKGLFGSVSLPPNGDLVAMRHYLLAKTMWRPETDTKTAITEFCRLYYGKAGEDIIKYVDLTHKTFYTQNVPFKCQGGGMTFDDEYIAKADSLLSHAEQVAETPVIKQRVAVARLGVWYVMLAREFERTGRAASLPMEWKFKIDPQNIGLKEEWGNTVKTDGWATVRTDKSWTYQGFDYHGAAWYATSFELSDHAVSRESDFSLFFGAVDGICDIFLDGRKIGEQKVPPDIMWNRSFYIPVHKLAAGQHSLIIRVEKDHSCAGIWKPVSLIDKSLAVPESVKDTAQRFLDVSKSAGVTQLSEWYGPPGEQLEKELYPKIRALLERKPKGTREAVPEGTMQKPGAFLDNGHRTFSVIPDESSANGSVAVQIADRDWTIGQGMNWYISDILRDAEKTGVRYRLRARIKVEKSGNEGSAFMLGYWASAEEGRDWSGETCDSLAVNSDMVKNDQWQWFELKDPILYRKPPHGLRVFVVASNNPKNISRVFVDSFELVPVK
jgi:hypothetical protein